VSNKTTKKESDNFEKAKQGWLSRIQNKTWTTLTYERELEIDSKVNKIMTPEYIASWGKTEDVPSKVQN
jgi:hypothetical protein